MREVNCVKLKKTAEGLERVHYPGELGQFWPTVRN